MKSFAFALNNIIWFIALQSHRLFFESIYTNLNAERLSLLSAADRTHISTRYTRVSVLCICSDLFTSWNPERGCMHLPRSPRAICLLFVHRNSNPSIYPALPACPLRSLCSHHQRYLALFYWQSLLQLLSLHHIHTSKYAHWVLHLQFVWICAKKTIPLLPVGYRFCFMLETTHQTKSRGMKCHASAWILPADSSAGLRTTYPTCSRVMNWWQSWGVQVSMWNVRTGSRSCKA